MGIKFGEVDASQILDNEFRINVLEEIIEWILDNNESLTAPTKENLVEIRKSVVERLQKKYPKSGITYKGD